MAQKAQPSCGAGVNPTPSDMPGNGNMKLSFGLAHCLAPHRDGLLLCPPPKCSGFPWNTKKCLTSADPQAQQVLYNTLNHVCQCRHSIKTRPGTSQPDLDHDCEFNVFYCCDLPNAYLIPVTVFFKNFQISDIPVEHPAYCHRSLPGWESITNLSGTFR